MEIKVTEKYFYEGDNKNASRMESSDGRWFERKYDEKGNEIFYKDFKGLEKTTTYDEDGNIILEQDSKGNTISYKYDEQKRVIEVCYSFNQPSIVAPPPGFNPPKT